MLRQALLTIFAEQVLNSGWDVKEFGKVAAAAQLFFKLSSVNSKTERKYFVEQEKRGGFCFAAPRRHKAPHIPVPFGYHDV